MVAFEAHLDRSALLTTPLPKLVQGKLNYREGAPTHHTPSWIPT